MGLNGAESGRTGKPVQIRYGPAAVNPLPTSIALLGWISAEAVN
jgi:hypothetical protein